VDFEFMKFCNILLKFFECVSQSQIKKKIFMEFLKLKIYFF